MANYLSGRGRDFGNNKPKASGSFISVQTEMQELVEKREQIMNSAAKNLATFIKSANDSGESNVHSLEDQVSSLIGKFSKDEQVIIMRKAIAIAIVNL